MALDATTARSIIKQAIKDETYTGDEPEDDATCIQEADQLVEMAEAAWGQFIRSPEVETILKLANKAPQNGDGTPEAEEPQTPPEPQSDDEESETAPEVDLSSIDPQLTKIEPWEGYGEERVKDITEGVNLAMQDAPDDLAELLTHVFAYESSHRRRVRVLKHVTEALQKIGVNVEVPATTPAETEASGVRDESGEGVPPATEGQEHPVGESDAPAEPVSEARQTGSEAGTGKSADKAPAQNRATGSSDGIVATSFGNDENPAYRALIEGVERELETERTHVPKKLPEPVPDLPWRWADISNSDLHDFHMQYAAAAYYTQYVVARHERIAMHCREAADELHRQLLTRAEKYDAKGKAIPVTVLEAEIESDVNVKSWRKRQRKHEQFASAAKRELESQHKMVESLSRLETMRHNSWERARR